MCKDSLFLGIDACRGGWVGASMNADLQYVGAIDFWPNAAALFADLPCWQLALIDMPIGLTDDESGIRACEPLARKMLGAKHSSIFSPPAREALHAPNYVEACRINAEICGKKISKQTWNILPKIREIDALMTPQLQSHVYECHPEVALMQSNDAPAPLPKKVKSNGTRKFKFVDGQINQAGSHTVIVTWDCGTSQTDTFNCQ